MHVECTVAIDQRLEDDDKDKGHRQLNEVGLGLGRKLQ